MCASLRRSWMRSMPVTASSLPMTRSAASQRLGRVARRHAAAFQLALPADRSSVVRRNPGQLAYAGNLNLLIETLARNARYALYLCAALRLRVAAAFFADADRALAGRFAAAAPPSLPPLRDEA